MPILQGTQIKKQYGARTVLDFERLQIYEGDRIGVVGANGSGKSTLLGILCGEIAPDSGQVTRRWDVALIRQMPEREGTLSGGENAKRRILQATQRLDTVVLADEPTANLDGDGVDWVRGKLLAASTVLLVSHDRDLLDSVCNRIIEIRDGKLSFYTGNFTDYERQVEEGRARQRTQYGQYRHQKAQLESAVQVREKKMASQRQKKRRETARNSSEARLGRDKRSSSMKQQEHIAKVLKGRLDRLEEVERIKEVPKLSLDFSLTEPPGSRVVITCDNLHFSYGATPVFTGASFVVKNGAKVALTGKNGSGKSTLLRLIYEGHRDIRLAPKLKPGFLYQSFENLNPDWTALDNVLATSVQDKGTVRGILAGLLFRKDEVFKRARVLSGGEKMRLSLAKLIAADHNALLLDEPTNYLDILSLEAVEEVLRQYPGTLLVVSHDRRFVGRVTGQELRVQDGAVTPVEEQAAPNPAEKTRLELRRMQLLGEISAAPPEEKTTLELEYAQVVERLRSW